MQCSASICHQKTANYECWNVKLPAADGIAVEKEMRDIEMIMKKEKMRPFG
ncbi:conserved hypothetical protein [Roseibium sp. TrichSKD4]|nr:conserved hypothetical protein [Roseibium sp. TrichSKD4]